MRLTLSSVSENKQKPGFDLEDTGRIFNRKTIKKGVILFLFISIAALAGIFLYSNTENSLEALSNLKPVYLLLIFPLSFLDLWLGGLRIHVFTRKLNPGASTWLSFRANLANIFMGAVTPSQTGGGPAQLFILHQGGISVARGMSIGVINFLSTIVFFVIASGGALLFLGGSFSSKIINHLIIAGFVVFCLQFIIVLTALLKPSIFERFFHFLTGLFSRVPRIAKKTESLREWFGRFVEHYGNTCKFFFNKELMVVAQSFVLTAVLYLNKFTLAYFIMKGIGGAGGYMDVIALHMLIFFISYFAPSPGASGVAELTTAALMSSVISRNLLPVFTLLQRFFLLYIPVILGVFTVLRALKGAETRNIPGDSAEESGGI
ncbi:MAG: flippase-like domain-containing protein [Candidatus Fermentibacteraceae bacterium]|nr:flippase-like domain-containing protein [Candidatus Fermentibacteraceae bacterium]